MINFNDHRNDVDNSVNDNDKFKLSIPHLTDLLRQSAEEKKIMEDILESIFKNAAIIDVSEKIRGNKNV